MRLLTNNYNEEVRAHLVLEFESINEYHGVMAPPRLAHFIVEESLQTADMGLGVKEIPPGTYFVKKELHCGTSSHFLSLENENGEEVFIEVGYVGDDGNGNCIDWRGVENTLKKEEISSGWAMSWAVSKMEQGYRPSQVGIRPVRK